MLLIISFENICMFSYFKKINVPNKVLIAPPLKHKLIEKPSSF